MKKIIIIIGTLLTTTSIMYSTPAVGTLQELVRNKNENVKSKREDVKNKSKNVKTKKQELKTKNQNLKISKNLITDEIKNQLKKSLDAINNNPYKTQVAHVRAGNELSVDEQTALNNRSQITDTALEKLLNQSLGKNIKLPKVSFIASGGGYRAMTITLGFLEGAQQTGLFDTITYMAALSGSTWALAGYLNALAQDASNGYMLTAQQYSDQLYTLIDGKSLISGEFDPDDIHLLTDALLVDLAYDQPTTAVSLYGILLANRFLGTIPDRNRRYISQQSDIVKSGQTVIPIYTAVQGEDDLNQTQLEWYEFTPWEMGGAWLKHYVPMWAYGRVFKQGTSQDDAPEKSLGFNLGTFGSAFSVTLLDLWNEENITIDSPIIQEAIDEISHLNFASKRVTYAEVFNFTLDVPDTMFQNKETIRLVDAGFAFNLPYPAVSEERPERASDILIFLDASEILEGATQLKLASEYALRKNLKFPKINFDELQGKTIAFKIFKDDNDPSVPIVIYMTATNGNLSPDYPADFDLKQCTEHSFCATDNFTITKQEAAILRKAAQANIIAVQNQILDVYRNWINTHNTP